jgi:hypothetical protein
MKSLTAVVLAFLAPGIACAQSQPSTTPTPGAEVQKLGYYVGTWNGHGESKGGPFGPPGKLSSKMTCDWFAGGFQVVCRGEETGPTGTRGFLNILSYDEKARSYTEYGISSLGDAEYDQGGTLVDNTLTYLVDQAEGGKAIKLRYTEVHASPGRMTYRAEASLGGAPWAMIAEGEIIKAK